MTQPSKYFSSTVGNVLKDMKAVLEEVNARVALQSDDFEKEPLRRLGTEIREITVDSA